MRAYVGKPIRERLVAGVPKALPGFSLAKSNSKGAPTYWVWRRSDGALRQWLVYMPDRYEERFTIELSWSMVSDDPFQAPFGDATEPFTTMGTRCRLGALFTNQLDYLWYVSDPPPNVLELSQDEFVAQFVRQVINPVVLPPEEVAKRVDSAADDALSRLHDFGAPHFQRVRAWASEQPRPGV